MVETRIGGEYMSELDGTERERKQKELFRSAMVKARAKGYGVDTARIYAENYVQGFAEGVMQTVVKFVLDEKFC